MPVCATDIRAAERAIVARHRRRSAAVVPLPVRGRARTTRGSWRRSSDSGYRDVGWDVDGDDWRPGAARPWHGAADGRREAVARGDGAVVLLHPWPTATGLGLRAARSTGCAMPGRDVRTAGRAWREDASWRSTAGTRRRTSRWSPRTAGCWRRFAARRARTRRSGSTPGMDGSSPDMVARGGRRIAGRTARPADRRLHAWPAPTPGRDIRLLTRRLGERGFALAGRDPQRRVRRPSGRHGTGLGRGPHLRAGRQRRGHRARRRTARLAALGDDLAATGAVAPMSAGQGLAGRRPGARRPRAADERWSATCRRTSAWRRRPR